MDGNDVLKKIGLLIGVAACGALVTSCGGGDPEPTPTPTETATPTPTPTTSGVFDLTAAFQASSTNANLIYAYFTPTGGAETFNDASRLNGVANVSLAFDPETATFLFPDLPDPVTYDSADLVSSSSTSRVYAEGDTSLTLELPFSEVLRVTYEIDDQAFTRNSTAGTLRSQRVALFLNNVTTTADITSTLTYTGTPVVAGGEPGVTPAGAVTSQATTFTITPGTDDTVTATITIFQTVGGATTQVAQFAINEELGANGGFSGAIDDTTNGLKGVFAGGLAGANREELVLIFSLANADDGREYVGTLIADR